MSEIFAICDEAWKILVLATGQCASQATYLSASVLSGSVTLYLWKNESSWRNRGSSLRTQDSFPSRNSYSIGKSIFVFDSIGKEGGQSGFGCAF